MDKIKRYKDFKGREYCLDDLSDIVEGTLAYLTDEGFVFSTETFFNDMQIFINLPPIGDNPPYKYEPFSWSSVKDYIIVLFERLEKRFSKDWDIKVFLKITTYYRSETEISYQEMSSFTIDAVYGIRICLS